MSKGRVLHLGFPENGRNLERDSNVLADFSFLNKTLTNLELYNVVQATTCRLPTIVARLISQFQSQQSRLFQC